MKPPSPEVVDSSMAPGSALSLRLALGCKRPGVPHPVPCSAGRGLPAGGWLRWAAQSSLHPRAPRRDQAGPRGLTRFSVRAAELTPYRRLKQKSTSLSKELHLEEQEP